jgi:hypothetical protein
MLYLERTVVYRKDNKKHTNTMRGDCYTWRYIYVTTARLLRAKV